jgi:dephospho-CoA kinase
VHTPAVLRVERLVRTRGLERDEAERRIAAQATDDERLAVADVVLDGSGAPEDLQRQVDELWDRLAAERHDEQEVDAP